MPDSMALRRILERNTSIAVVGLSLDPHRPSHYTSLYMQRHGYRIIPVNPGCGEVLGEPCYGSLQQIEEPVHMVLCFRRPEHIPPIAEDAIRIGARVLWLQLGIVNQQAASRARAAGLEVVMDRCIKIEHARLIGA